MNSRNGHHVAHAAVTLDGHLTRFTNASGQVSFKGVPSGRHAIQITATDGAALTASVSLHPGESQLVSYQLGGSGMSMTPLIWTILIVAAALLAGAACASWGVLGRRRRRGTHRRDQGAGRPHYGSP